MIRCLFATGAALGFIGVTAGAFGAHALESKLAPDRLATWELAVRYQLVHGLALLAAAWAASRWPGFPTIWTGALMLGGTVVFCGTLYALSLGAPRWLGAVTPIGGLALLAGWATMIVGAWRG